MNLIKAIWEVFNGKKFSTGTAITLLAFLLQQAFAKFGLEHDQALTMATYLVQAAGVIIMIVGYIHQWIKAGPPKK